MLPVDYCYCPILYFLNSEYSSIKHLPTNAHLSPARARESLNGIDKTVWSTAQVIVTDRERTILDCVDRVDLAGGFEEAFKSLLSIANVNFDRLYQYAKKEHKKVLFHKLGLFLSFKEIKEAWNMKLNCT